MFLSFQLINKEEKFDFTNIDICIDDTNFVYSRNIKVFDTIDDYIADEDKEKYVYEDLFAVGATVDFVVFYNELKKIIEKFSVTEIICFNDMFKFAFQWNCIKYRLNHCIDIQIIDIASMYKKCFANVLAYDEDVIVKAFNIDNTSVAVKTLYEWFDSLTEIDTEKFIKYLKIVRAAQEVKKSLCMFNTDDLKFIFNYMINEEDVTFKKFIS